MLASLAIVMQFIGLEPEDPRKCRFDVVQKGELFLPATAWTASFAAHDDELQIPHLLQTIRPSASILLKQQILIKHGSPARTAESKQLHPSRRTPVHHTRLILLWPSSPALLQRPQQIDRARGRS